MRFEQTEIEYLGLRIAYNKDHDGSHQKSKVLLIGQFPHNVTDVRSFLGFTNFIDHFIHNFSEVAKPLNALLQKDAKMGMGQMSNLSV